MDLKVLALPVFAVLMLAEAVITTLQGREAYEWFFSDIRELIVAAYCELYYPREA